MTRKGKKITEKKIITEDDRLFGYFKCPKCKRSWRSGFSWINIAQQCKKCKTPVVAWDQKELEKKQKDDEDDEHGPPHPRDLCGKCKKLGYFCGTKYRYPRNR